MQFHSNMQNIAIIFIITILSLFSCTSTQRIPTISYSIKNISTPIPFAEGIISTKENSEFDLTFSPNGRQLYFTRRKPTEKQKIYESNFSNGQWSTPKIAAFSTDRDETPFITPNGKYLFFGSERPIPNQPNLGNFDMNIWKMEKTNNGWSQPISLPDPINQVQIKGEEWPSSNNNLLFSNDNQTFYFTTMQRGTKTVNLFQTTFDGKNFQEPKPITGFFTDPKFWIYSAVISPNGKFLVFNSYGATGGQGGEDLFVSTKTEQGWSIAKSIGNLVNTSNEESSPRFSRDGKYFFFSRAANLGNDEYGEWDIFFVETEYLYLDKLF